MMEFVKVLRDKSFDVVFLFDVLEHVTSEQGWELLEQLKSIARKRILIWLPFGVTPQDEYGGNEWQTHKSTWEPADFDMLPNVNVEVIWKHFHISGTPSAGFVTIEIDN